MSNSSSEGWRLARGVPADRPVWASHWKHGNANGRGSGVCDNCDSRRPIRPQRPDLGHSGRSAQDHPRTGRSGEAGGNAWLGLNERGKGRREGYLLEWSGREESHRPRRPECPTGARLRAHRRRPLVVGGRRMVLRARTVNVVGAAPKPAPNRAGEERTRRQQPPMQERTCRVRRVRGTPR